MLLPCISMWAQGGEGNKCYHPVVYWIILTVFTGIFSREERKTRFKGGISPVLKIHIRPPPQTGSFYFAALPAVILIKQKDIDERHLSLVDKIIVIVEFAS